MRGVSNGRAALSLIGATALDERVSVDVLVDAETVATCELAVFDGGDRAPAVVECGVFDVPSTAFELVLRVRAPSSATAVLDAFSLESL